jgi:hypothetical protein
MITQAEAHEVVQSLPTYWDWSRADGTRAVREATPGQLVVADVNGRYRAAVVDEWPQRRPGQRRGRGLSLYLRLPLSPNGFRIHHSNVRVVDPTNPTQLRIWLNL